MLIEIINDQKDLSIDTDSAKEILRYLLIQLKVRCDEISLHFVDKKTICELHDTFFQDPSPTDCITFPIDEQEDGSFYRVLGEVFVCPLVGIEYAQENDLDPYEEVCLYMIHGLLHLLGFDDIEEKDRLNMRKKEEWCMKKLKAKKIKLNSANGNALL